MNFYTKDFPLNETNIELSQKDETKQTTFLVEVPLTTLINNNIEMLNDYIEEIVLDGGLLSDISYTIDSKYDENIIILAVQADIVSI